MAHLSDQLLLLSQVCALADKVQGMAYSVKREDSVWYTGLAQALLALAKQNLPERG
jgi:hypothetical protein